VGDTHRKGCLADAARTMNVHERDGTLPVEPGEDLIDQSIAPAKNGKVGG
jgi:hypothetical protein